MHKAFSEFWVQRHAGPVSGRPFLSLPDCAQPAFVRLPSAGAQVGCSVTLPLLVFLSDAKDQVHGQSAQNPENGQDNVDFKLL